MHIQIPKITRPLSLGGYAEQLALVTIHVWVNPPREFLDRRKELQGSALWEWWAELWSQGPDPGSRWTGAEVEALMAPDVADTDPGLMPWLIRQTWDLIAEHRAGEKKA